MEPPRRWVRDTTFFLSGQTVSLFGSSLVQYAILWYLTLETQSGVVLTLATAFGFLPQAVMSVFGGVWADRHNRKFLLIGADAVIAVTTLVLAIMLWNGFDGLWLVYTTLAIRSLGAGVQTPAVGALLPQIVPVDKLMRVNGINMSIQSAMTLLAPALAAVLFALMGLQAVLIVDVVTAAIGISLVAVIPVARVVRSDEGASYLADLRAGLSYTRHHAVVLRVLAFFAVVFVLMAPPGYLTPLMVVRTFGEDVWRLTANEVAFGVGMLAGGALISAWGGFRDRMRMLVATSLAFGILSVCMGLSGDILGLPGSFAVFLGFMLLTGVGVSWFSTTATTLLQEQVDPEVQGRVFGLVGIVLAVAMPVGMLIFGPLADTISVEWILVLTGIITVLVTFAVAYRAPTAEAGMITE
ncbi:MAG: MFS transporter [Actinobacteria bacterium]|nr:MFS transporter [Actinomycetota bacterium]